jgi:hypothetical protein
MNLFQKIIFNLILSILFTVLGIYVFKIGEYIQFTGVILFYFSLLCFSKFIDNFAEWQESTENFNDFEDDI